jgi:uncharacterized membrane protein
LGAGGWLVLHGLRRGGIGGVALLGAGALCLERGATGHCRLYQSLGGNSASSSAQTNRDLDERGILVTTAYTINKSAEELFKFWRNFDNLPSFMTHLEDVKIIDDKRSHWKAKAPAGWSVEWEAEITEDDPNKAISWKSLEGADIPNRGSVLFTEVPERGTEVKVALQYLPPLGKFGSLIARIFGEEPHHQIKEDLRHFKQLMEAGEIPTNQGPRGSCRMANSNGGRL